MKFSSFSLFIVLSSCIFYTSCIDSKNNKLIIGKWQASQWLGDANTTARNAEGTSFQFDENGKYLYEYNRSLENGTYKVENNMLFTKSEGMQEIMVKIAKLTSDSLVFEMNRSGTAETLILLKSK
ncbi:MAG: lipocalin family protein [Bacteroidota bacterium]